MALEASRKLKLRDVIIVLAELTTIRSAPRNIRSDNGSELVTNVTKERRKESRANNMLHIKPRRALTERDR